MTDKTLSDLFHDSLRDLYYTERRIAKALPRMARKAASPALKAALDTHHGETERQLDRLQRVFELISKRARSKSCPAIEGILDEAEEAIDEFKGTAVLDAALIASARAVEHYEIARYDMLIRWAGQLELPAAAALLGETLAEETAAEAALTALAEGKVRETAPA